MQSWNMHLVGVLANRVLINRPSNPLSYEQALNLAAWLAVMAECVEPEGSDARADFNQLLILVRNT